MVVRRVKQDYDDEYASDVPPPWEIGTPQPALAALLDRIDTESPVLDAGCGTGELALQVALKGHRVVGVDYSEAAIVRARAKAAGRGLDVEFLVLDARQLADLGLRPRTVVDSGLLHNLDSDGRAAYLAGLATICDAGALVCVLAVSAVAGQGWDVTADGLAELFAGPDWIGTSIEPAEVHAVVAGEEVRLPSFLLTTRRG